MGFIKKKCVAKGLNDKEQEWWTGGGGFPGTEGTTTTTPSPYYRENSVL